MRKNFAVVYNLYHALRQDPWRWKLPYIYVIVWIKELERSKRITRWGNISHPPPRRRKECNALSSDTKGPMRNAQVVSCNLSSYKREWMRWQKITGLLAASPRHPFPLDQMASNGGSNCLLDSCGMTLHEGFFDPSSETTTYHKSSTRPRSRANKSWKLCCLSEQWLQHGTVMPQLPVLLVPVEKHQEDNKAMLMVMRVLV